MAPLAPAVALVGLMTATAAAEAPWRVGFASADITPEESIRFKAYRMRDEPSAGVLDRLHAKAMAIEATSGGERALLITADLCVLRRPLEQALADRVMEATGLTRRQILFNVSHTHAAPLVGRSEWFRYDMSETQKERVAAYTKRFKKTVERIATEAVSKVKPAKLAYGAGYAPFVLSRRDFKPSGRVWLGRNPRGYADQSVPVLRVRSREGQLRGLLFGAAAHATTLTGKNRKISGDYPGFAQHRIEEETDAQAMFLTGCAGSANPYPRRSVKWARRHGRTLADEVMRVAGGRMRPIEGPLRVAYGKADLPLADVPPRDRLKEMAQGRIHHKYNAARMLEALKRGEKLPGSYEAPLAVWRFGDDLTLAGMPGEIVGEYVPLIEDAIGGARLWPAGYCNDVFGYLPTARVLRRGGYETKGLIAEIGFFSPEAEGVLLNKLRSLARRVGRDIPPNR